MKSFDVNKVMNELIRTNPNGFINECHFQLEFGFALKRVFPRYTITFEWNQNKKRIDLIADDKRERIGFEFKYFTKKESQPRSLKYGTKISFKSHRNADLHRIGFWKDIEKLEGLLNDKRINSGYCLFLTNDFNAFDKTENADKDFDISNGTKPISSHLIHRTKQGDVDYEANVLGKYTLENKVYGNDFYYLIVPIF